MQCLCEQGPDQTQLKLAEQLFLGSDLNLMYRKPGTPEYGWNKQRLAKNLKQQYGSWVRGPGRLAHTCNPSPIHTKLIHRQSNQHYHRKDLQVTAKRISKGHRVIMYLSWCEYVLEVYLLIVLYN